MKKMLIALTIMLASISLSASAATTTGTANSNATSNATATATFGLKQTIVFSDNSQVEIFYVKDSEGYKVCSEANLNAYSFDKLLTIKSTSMELCRQYKGKVYCKAATISEVRKMANNLYRQLNSWADGYESRTGKSLEEIVDNL